MYTYTCVHVYIYIYIYRERERDVLLSCIYNMSYHVVVCLSYRSMVYYGLLNEP